MFYLTGGEQRPFFPSLAGSISYIDPLIRYLKPLLERIRLANPTYRRSMSSSFEQPFLAAELLEHLVVRKIDLVLA